MQLVLADLDDLCEAYFNASRITRACSADGCG
jgi:hypothetical protein